MKRFLSLMGLIGALVWAGLASPVVNLGFGPGTTVRWSSSTGSWSIVDGLLQGENGRALVAPGFGAARWVEATVASVTGEWAAVVVKYLGETDWVEARVAATGVTLVARAGGQEKSWSSKSSIKFPATVGVALSGNRIRIFVGGQLLLEAGDPALAGGGQIGLAARGRARFSQLHASAFAGPTLITSLGRSPGGLMAKVLAERVGLSHEYLEAAQPGDLGNAGTLVLVLGASAKGLGAAGISLDDEVARGRALVAEARRRGLGIIALHIEGEPRRGTLSDVLINEFVPQADYVVVKSDGNNDGLFTTLCQTRGLPLRVITTTAETSEVLGALFGLWP